MASLRAVDSFSQVAIKAVGAGRHLTQQGATLSGTGVEEPVSGSSTVVLIDVSAADCSWALPDATAESAGIVNRS